MIFDFISQEDDLASAYQAAGLRAPGGGRQVLLRVLRRYFFAVWCLAGMALGLKAVAIGFFLIWIGHPVLVAMRLSDLARRERLVSDGGQHDWFVSIGGIRQGERILSLKNAFFYSQAEMRKVLTGFCRWRVLLYLAAAVAAAHDLHGLWQGGEADHDLGRVARLMAGVNAVFFVRRSVAYLRLLALGRRQAWHVGTVSRDERPMYAAYKPCPGSGGEGRFYVPYMLAILTPQLV